MSFVELDALGRVYSTGRVLVTALADVTLSLERGRVLAVTGASGSGKSTLLNLLGNSASCVRPAPISPARPRTSPRLIVNDMSLSPLPWRCWTSSRPGHDSDLVSFRHREAVWSEQHPPSTPGRLKLPGSADHLPDV